MTHCGNWNWRCNQGRATRGIMGKKRRRIKTFTEISCPWPPVRIWFNPPLLCCWNTALNWPELGDEQHFASTYGSGWRYPWNQVLILFLSIQNTPCALYILHVFCLCYIMLHLNLRVCLSIRSDKIIQLTSRLTDFEEFIDLICYDLQHAQSQVHVSWDYKILECSRFYS